MISYCRVLGVAGVSRNLVVAIGLLLLGFSRNVAPVAGQISTQAPDVRAASSRGDSLDAWIESVRSQHNIPAMGAVVLRADTILALGISGVRRAGVAASVTVHDRFQLGSNTKAVTATLIATLVEAGKLSWTTTLADVFPEMRDSMSAEFRGVTLEQLLSHHAGISPFANTDDNDFKKLPRLKGSPMECRLAFTAWVLRGTPVAPPGMKAIYSNGGYTIAAAIAERVTGKSWESLVRERVFSPLGVD